MVSFPPNLPEETGPTEAGCMKTIRIPNHLFSFLSMITSLPPLYLVLIPNTITYLPPSLVLKVPHPLALNTVTKYSLCGTFHAEKVSPLYGLHIFFTRNVFSLLTPFHHTPLQLPP